MSDNKGLSDKKAVRAKITGRVQGVNFRMATMQAADEHGVRGWVMNTPDGAVEAYFEGDADDVDSLIQWCHSGPSMASVSEVKVSDETYTGEYNDFSIRYT